MKLPTDKNKRMQVLAGIGGVAAIVLGLIIWLGIVRPLQIRGEAQRIIAETQSAIDAADQEIKSIEPSLKTRKDVLDRILKISDPNFIRPVYGNYAIHAKRILNETAATLKLPLPTISSSPDLVILAATGKGGKMPVMNCRAFTTQVQMEASYADLRKYLEAIERLNPMVTLVYLRIDAQPQRNKLLHQISMTLQWPVWADESMWDKINEMIAHADELPSVGAAPVAAP